MTRLTRIVVNMLFVVLMLVISITASAQANAQVRFVHVVPDAVPVDVYVNGTLTVEDLTYGGATEYITVPAGPHLVTVTAAGLSATLWEQAIVIEAGSATTFIADNAAAPQFAPYTDNLATTAFGTSRLAVVHAIEGGPSVTVSLAEAVTLGGSEQAAGTPIVPELAYGVKFGDFDLPAQAYRVDVAATSSEAVILDDLSLPLTSNTSYMAVVYGTPTSPAALLLATRTTPAADTGLVRFVHGIVGGPTVDVLVNETIIAPSLTPDTPTEHIALPAGDHDVSFVDTDSGDEIGSTSITVAAEAQTVAAVVVDGEPVISVFADDLSGVDEKTVGASVLNTIDGASVTVTLADGTVIGEAAAGEQAATTAFAPVVSVPSFTISIDDQEGTIDAPATVFYGGTYYNIIVLDADIFGAPSLVIAPSSIGQTLDSAPGADQTIDVTGDPAPPGDTSSSSSSGGTAAGGSSEGQAAAPTEAAPVVEQQPVTVPEDTVLGEVALDPSANLNLRQFPNANALVLGQAPSGVQLEIIGREGAPVALVEGDPPPPEAETYVDPVLDLGEGQDLDPSQTWVRVSYLTPDGGEIEAWTLSQYLIVTDDEGLVDLRDIDPVPGNVPGESVNTDVTPPPPPVDVVTAEVINLNATASLNIRRNPSAESEVIGQLPVGTVVELGGLLTSTTGFLSDSDWAFISYAPAEGGVITGWVSTQFMAYLLNGETTPVEEIIDEGLIDEVADDVVGEVNANAAPIVAATPDPQVDAYVAEIALDPGANLNLRRTPDVQGEVLQQIPSGTLTVVTARTADTEWLQTSYEGQTGWVASQFVIVTFNGDFISDLTEIPVDTTVNANAVGATETP